MTTLKGITWDHPRGFDPLVACADIWREKTGINVTWERRSLQAFADVPISELARQYDLAIIDHPHVGQLAKDRSVIALPMHDVATIGGSAESYVWDGECFAYAIDAACQMAVRRSDFVGPRPRHWEDFRGEDAAQFRAITPLKPVDAFDALLTLAASEGASIPANSENFLTRDAMARGLGVLRALYNLGPSDAVDWNPIHVLDMLSAPDCEFAYSPCLFGYVNYAHPDFRPHPLAYLDLPKYRMRGGRAAILGGAGIAVSSQCAEPEAAIAHAQWLASQDVQAGPYLTANGQPAALHAWDEGKTLPDYQRFFAGAYSTMQRAWTRPRDEWFLDFVDEVCAIMPDFFLREIPVNTFADQIDALYRKFHGAPAK